MRSKYDKRLQDAEIFIYLFPPGDFYREYSNSKTAHFYLSNKSFIFPAITEAMSFVATKYDINNYISKHDDSNHNNDDRIKLIDYSINKLSYDHNEFTNKTEEETSLTKIKINNKIIHQSKLINYFRSDITKQNVEKDLNDLLKKIKKDKKYYISTKDIILIESLKSDGVQVLKKYEDFYQIDDSNMPTDIQFLIDNDEIGLVLLRLVEVIGQDEIQDIGSETLYFIISALNQLDIDPLRNKILLKVLPLKVKKYN